VADALLDYRMYAGIRATTGRDIVAVLFSSNALEMRKGQLQVSAEAAQKLGQVLADRIGLATEPVRPQGMLQAVHFAYAIAAPFAFAPFAVQRTTLRAALGSLPSDQAILVGAYNAEAEWCAAARLAGYIPAASFFAR